MRALASRPTDRPLRSVTVPAMGGLAWFVTDAAEESIGARRLELVAMERLWSRFLPDSEISALNRATGPALVSSPTAEILELAVEASIVTDGWFDVTVGRHVVGAGYDRSFDMGFGPPAPEIAPPAAGHEMWVDVATGLVIVPPGRSVDLGGIGKGRAADLLASGLRDDGASLAAVTVGGDTRIIADGRCVVPVRDQLHGAAPARLVLSDGGVAVSGPTRRRAADGRHHLIDPRTGRSARPARIAIVVATTAARAEVLATAAAVAPLDAAITFLRARSVSAWLVGLDGRIVGVGRPERHLDTAGWLDEAEPAVA